MSIGMVSNIDIYESKSDKMQEKYSFNKKKVNKDNFII